VKAGWVSLLPESATKERKEENAKNDGQVTTQNKQKSLNGGANASPDFCF
jgi:hypothetical protein